MFLLSSTASPERMYLLCGTAWGEETINQHLANPIEVNVLQPDNSTAFLQEKLCEGNLLGYLWTQPWFRHYKNTIGWLLRYSRHRVQLPLSPSIQWSNMPEPLRLAIFSGEWRRQMYGSIWGRGTIDQETKHFENRAADLLSADENLRVVSGLLEEARTEDCSRDLLELEGIYGCDPMLSAYTKEILGAIHAKGGIYKGTKETKSVMGSFLLPGFEE